MSWHIVDTVEPWLPSRLVSDSEYNQLLLQGLIYSATPSEDAVVAGSLLPATQGQVGALGTRIDNSIAIFYNVKDYGAKGDGVTDDSTAIQAAITATQAGTQKGGRLFFPHGIYICATYLNAAAAENLIFEGTGGRTAGIAASTIIKYTGPDAANIIDLRSSFGCGVRDLQILHTSVFTGNVIDFRNALGAGLLALGTAYGNVHNCYIGGMSGNRTAVGVALDNSTRITIDRVAFYTLAICIKGRSLSGQSNQITITECGFNQYSAVAIRNPGQAWSIRDCTFEGTSDSPSLSHSIDHDAGIYAEGLKVEGCWTGDSINGHQFTVSGYGISFINNWIGASLGEGIYVDEFVKGLWINSNRFYSNLTSVHVEATSVTVSSNERHYIMGNAYGSVTTRYTGPTPPVSGIYADDSTGTTTVAGLLTLTDGSNLSAGTTAGTKIATAASQKLGFWAASPRVQPILAYSQSHAVATSVLLNGSFDSNVASWSTGAGTYSNTLTGTLTRITTDFGPSDNSSQACADIVYTAAANQQGIAQSVTSQPALTTFYASAWVRNLSGRPVRMRMKDVTNAGATVDTATVATDGLWHFLSSNLTTGASATTITLAIVTDTGTAAGEFYVDEVRLGSVTTAESEQTARMRRVLANLGLISDQTVA